MSLKTLRLAHSQDCELKCGYCKTTQTKSTRSSEWPKFLPKAQHLVLPCNSFYREDLELQLEKTLNYEQISLEFHFLTLSLERHQEKLARLAKKNYGWIVHIDHFDSGKFGYLKAWDKNITEYRIIPSQLYPAALYLKKLPDFIQSKITWQFLQKDASNPAFQPLEDHPQTVRDLQNAPLHHFKLSASHWPNTLESGSEPLLKGLDWSVIDARLYESTDWPLQLLQTQTEYVGIFNNPDAQALSFLNKKPGQFVYYGRTKEHDVLNKKISFYAPKNSNIYFLENVLVQKEIWALYVKIYTTYNHWTWTDFLKIHNIKVETVDAITSVSRLNEKNLRQAGQSHYLQTLDQKFYDNNFFFLQDRGFAGKIFYHAFSFLFLILSFLPQLFYEKLNRAFRKTKLFIEDGIYSFLTTHQELKKFLNLAMNKTYWAIHALFWKIIDLGWRVIDAGWAVYGFSYQTYGSSRKFYWRAYWAIYKIIAKIYGSSITVYWTMCQAAWWGYGHIWAPVAGFTVSLFDFPPEYDRQPFFKSIAFKFLFSARKLAWLILKMLGRR